MNNRSLNRKSLAARANYRIPINCRSINDSAPLCYRRTRIYRSLILWHGQNDSNYSSPECSPSAANYPPIITADASRRDTRENLRCESYPRYLPIIAERSRLAAAVSLSALDVPARTAARKRAKYRDMIYDTNDYLY